MGISFLMHWKDYHLEEARTLFQLVVENRTGNNGFKLWVGRYQQDIRENILSLRTVQRWN